MKLLCSVLTNTIVVGVLAFLTSAGVTRAGSFFANFDGSTNPPAGMTLFGNAVIATNGGFNGSGCLKLTTAAISQSGSVVIDDLDAAQPVTSFTATFKALVGGGTSADGFSFNFASDLPAGGFAEEGGGTGVTVEFDTYLNTSQPDNAPSIDLIVGGTEIATFAVPNSTLRPNTFVDVTINLKPSGYLDVVYDGVYAYSNYYIGFAPVSGGRFGFGARTGGQTDNHFIDEINITTRTNGSVAYLDTYAPFGRNIRPDTTLMLVLQDSGTQVNTNAIQLIFDGTNITSSAGISQSSPTTTISYHPPGLLAPSSAHTVSLIFADNAAPTPNTNAFQYDFFVPAYAALAPNLAAATGLFDTNASGFTVRFSQIVSDNIGATVSRAEAQLANLLIDNGTGLPEDNVADPTHVAFPENVVSTNNGTYTYLETNVINYSYSGFQGNITPDAQLPGIPGTTSDVHNYAMDAVTYLHLSPGFYNLGVNSSDGFRLTAASTPDIFASEVAVFDGTRAPADSLVTFAVSQDGYYPFRLVFFGGPAAAQGVVNPGTADPGVEFFSIDTNGVKTLINDATAVAYVPAYRSSAISLPYIQSVAPQIGESSVPGNTAVTIQLVDGSVTVQTNTIQLSINGTLVAPAITTNGAGGTKVFYQPPVAFTPNSTNTVQIAFTDSASNSRTNSYQFTVANILQQIWYLAPNSQNYLRSGTTERGLAYNPKTGHILLVSRSTTGGLVNPNVQVLSAADGSYVSSMSVVGISGGTFALNMIDVADDGVIYGANLMGAGSSDGPFKIYRWANESADPVLVYSGDPGTEQIGKKIRLGDTMRVRRSGAGTQILANGNYYNANAADFSTNAVVFTTIDATNFTATVLNVDGISPGDLRLGCAFGCGDTFYGAQTTSGNSRVRYVSFDLSTRKGTTLATYLLNNPTVATVGPLGVDIVNQRLIGNATSGTAGNAHSMNLYDLEALNPAITNVILDRRVFATANANFGTGAIDFTPDGTRVFTLDTANGIIAFSLTPSLGAPSICSQPRNDVVSVGGIGFFSADVVNAPQAFQWRFNGVNIVGATNATLDIYNVQQSNLGLYSVVISNNLGSVTSSVAYLDTPITFSTIPADQVVAVGGTATFSVVASNGVPGYTYQWKKNGANITGATTASLTITNAQAINGGSYAVTVSDSLGESVTTTNAVLTVGVLGTGSGLSGDYYSNQTNFSGVPALSRIDSTINFNFGTGSPDPSISSDTFAIRWSGQVQPFYSQLYTFFVTSDDGTRLWVNGQKLIDSWKNQPPTETSGTITLNANQKYDIVMEYYENAGGAQATLSWSSSSQPKQIIPQTQLYPAPISGAAQPLMTALVDGTGTNVIFNWSGSYVLQTSTNITGPFEDVAGSVSPYTNSLLSDPQRYFRLISE